MIDRLTAREPAVGDTPSQRGHKCGATSSAGSERKMKS